MRERVVRVAALVLSVGCGLCGGFMRACPDQSVCVQDGKSVVSGSGDKTVRVWDAATGKEVQKLEGHSARVSSVAFSPVGGVARAAGSCGRGVRGPCVICVFVVVCWDM